MDRCCDGEPLLVLVRSAQITLGRNVPVFGQRGLGTVWDAVFAQVTRAQVGSNHFQIAEFGPSFIVGACCPAAGRLPLCDGVALPGGRPSRGLPVIEVQQTSLFSSVSFHFESAIVLPRDVDASGHAHDGRRAVGAALLAGSFIFGWIPGVGELLGRQVDGDAGIVSLGGSHHPPAPILCDHRDPVAGQINGSGSLRCCRALGLRK